MKGLKEKRKLKEGRYINNPSGGEKEKMDKKYGIGIATIAVVITAAIFAGLLVSAYDHDQTYKWNATYFVPEDIRVTEYCKTATVDIWTNTSVKIIGGVAEFDYTFCCANVTGFTFNATNWPPATSSYYLTPGKVRLVPSNPNGIGPGPVHLGTLKIHCCNDSDLELWDNKLGCCLTNLTWNTTASYLQDLGGVKIPVNWKDGTFTCGVLSPTFSKTLYEGWNLISLPLTPSNNSTSAVLASIWGNVDAVYSYNSTSRQFESVYDATMDPCKGYFVHVTQNRTWIYSGTSAYTSMSTKLEPGLNMIGWLNCSKSISDALSSIAGNYNYVARWNANLQEFEVYVPGAPFNDFNTMERGKGYFISAKDGCPPLTEGCGAQD